MSAAAESISLDQVQACGIVGAGGGGFPAHVKLKAHAQTVILNAAECEPLLHKDKELLRCFGAEVVAGLESARKLVGAASAVIGIKYKYQSVIESLKKILLPGMSISELADSYPVGDEFVLVYDVTGKIIPPGKIPLAVGCVVINVETALNLGRAMPVTRKYLTVAGAVKQPVTIEVPMGVSFQQAIDMAGGATVDDPVVIVGGAMMGRFCDDLSTPVTKTTGGLIVVDREHPLAHKHTRTEKTIKIIGASACDQCTFCTSLCPRYLLGHPVEPHKAMRSLGFNLTGDASVMGSLFCSGCNTCTMIACPEDIDPRGVMDISKRRLMSENRRWQDAGADAQRAEFHLNNRRVPISRLIHKLGLHQFVNEGPLDGKSISPGKVVLPLKQHAGAPAEAAVRVGDTVKVGDCIAAPAPGALGATLHASIAGRVEAVDGDIVIVSE